MPKTSSECPQSGVYKGDCSCKKEIVLSKGEKFPPCSGCSKAINWTLVRSTK